MLRSKSRLLKLCKIIATRFKCSKREFYILNGIISGLVNGNVKREIKYIWINACARARVCACVCVWGCMRVCVRVGVGVFALKPAVKGMYRNVAELVNICILFFIFIWYNQQKWSLKYLVIVNNPISTQIFKA